MLINHTTFEHIRCVSNVFRVRARYPAVVRTCMPPRGHHSMLVDAMSVLPATPVALGTTPS